MLSSLCLFVFVLCGYGQDEGALIKKERFEFGKSLFFMAGPEFHFGKKADYTGGYTLKAGYVKRVNRIITLGPVLGFSRFAFQPSYSNSYKNGNEKGNNIFQVNDEDDALFLYYVFVVNMRGGNLNQFNLGLNTRINFIPYEADKKVSVYGMIEPFLLVSNRSKVTATTDVWSVQDFPFEDPKEWDPDSKELYEELGPNSPSRSHWANKTELTGGINVGLGIEISLPTHWKLYVQPALRYTLPITHINTTRYPALSVEGYKNPKYPFAKESFSSIGILFGIAHNF